MSEKFHFWLPQAASTTAPEVDRLFYFIYGLSVFFFLLVVLMMIYFVIKYRRRSDDETTPHHTHNTSLEVLWSVIPLLILIAIFFWGFNVYMDGRVAPNDALNIYVTARRWAWSFEYPNGTRSGSELVVPVNRPVKLTMSSEDLIHGFFIPAFRVKQDVLPNRYTSVWFQATLLGNYQLFCSQYCGTNHSGMLGKVRVVTPEEYAKWVETGGIDPSKMSLPEYGKALFNQQGCAACHSVDGSVKIGPSLKGVFGHQVALNNGQQIQADENYIRESIQVPAAKVVNGFQPIMPVIPLKQQQINALIEYIKTLK